MGKQLNYKALDAIQRITRDKHGYPIYEGDWAFVTAFDKHMRVLNKGFTKVYWGDTYGNDVFTVSMEKVIDADTLWVLNNEYDHTLVILRDEHYMHEY